MRRRIRHPDARNTEGAVTTRETSRSPWRLIGFVGISAGALLVAGAALLLFFPGATYERYLIHRITEAVSASYPEYALTVGGLRYSLLANRLELDSVRLTNADATMECSIAKLSVSGIRRTQLLWGGGVTPDQFSDAHASASGILLALPQAQYEVRCESLLVSARDSTLEGTRIEFQPAVDDEELFAADRFRGTAYHFSLPSCRVTGLDLAGLMRDDGYRARTVRLEGASASILINKDKPNNPAEPDPRMPNAMFSSITEPLAIDTIAVTGGRLMYNERFKVRGNAAAITCGNIQVTATGLGNTGPDGDTVEINVTGEFMGSGEMTMHMSLPLTSADESFRYSGTLRKMNLSSLNAFIEPAEHQRLKTGVVHGVQFDITVTNGSARGTVRASYEDLKIVAIDERSGSERGVVNTLASIFANNIKLRTSNMPDGKGAMKIGQVKYTRRHTEPFFQFAWFALRSGIGDAVGF
jgi:hypothetical protein